MAMIYEFAPEQMDIAREAIGLTEMVAAAHVGATKQQWRQWSSGRNIPNVRTLLKMCAAFNQPPEFFFRKISNHDDSVDPLVSLVHVNRV